MSGWAICQWLPWSLFWDGDCDGDGLADVACYDGDNNAAVLLSSTFCVDNWPNGDLTTCPGSVGVLLSG